MLSTRYCFLLLFVFLSGPVVAQSARLPVDSLTTADTIHLSKRRILFSQVREYSYHYASNLQDRQLMPLLRWSADSTVRAFAKRAQTAHYAFSGLTASGYALTAAGIFTPANRFRGNLPWLLGGIGLFYGSLLPKSLQGRYIERGVRAHNRYMRSRAGDYYSPVVRVSAADTLITLADTVSITHRLLANQYTYRYVRVYPAQQLYRLANRLNDAELNNGFQYSRRVDNVGGLLGGVGLAFLVPQVLIYGILTANGRSTRLNAPFVWTAAAFTAIGFGIHYHAGRVQLQTTRLLNERLRSRYNPARTAEHFQNP